MPQFDIISNNYLLFIFILLFSFYLFSMFICLNSLYKYVHILKINEEHLSNIKKSKLFLDYVRKKKKQ